MRSTDFCEGLLEDQMAAGSKSFKRQSVTDEILKTQQNPPLKQIVSNHLQEPRKKRKPRSNQPWHLHGIYVPTWDGCFLCLKVAVGKKYIPIP